MATDGSVTRPSFSEGDKAVTLTATINKGSASDTKTFTVTVKKLAATDQESVDADKASLALTFGGSDDADNVTQDITLDTSGDNGTTISWASSAPGYVATDGSVTRPSFSEGDKTVTLTATISKGSASDTKTFTVTVKAQEGEAQHGNISGVLVDSDGDPLAGFSVTLHSDPVTVVTDSAGEFTFTDVELTQHTLIIKKSDGTQIGEYVLNFTEGGAEAYSLNGNEINLTITSNTVAIDITISTDENVTGTSIEGVKFTHNPKTGDSGAPARLAYIIAIIAAGIVLVAASGIIFVKVRKKSRG